MVKMKTVFSSLVACFVFSAVVSSSALAAEAKIAVMNMQKVMADSAAGKDAQKVMESKMKELQQSFKKEEDQLLSLQQEIEKKSSAWSEEIKQKKAIEFQKMRRDLQNKQEDANLELKTLREKQLGPILKELEQVVQETAKAKGYTVVLPKNSVLYAGDEVNITAEITKALNEKMKKK